MRVERVPYRSRRRHRPAASRTGLQRDHCRDGRRFPGRVREKRIGTAAANAGRDASLQSGSRPSTSARSVSLSFGGAQVL